MSAIELEEFSSSSPKSQQNKTDLEQQRFPENIFEEDGEELKEEESLEEEKETQEEEFVIEIEGGKEEEEEEEREEKTPLRHDEEGFRRRLAFDITDSEELLSEDEFSSPRSPRSPNREVFESNIRQSFEYIKRVTRITKYLTVPRLKMFLFLVILGLTMGFLSVLFDVVVDLLMGLRHYLVIRLSLRFEQYGFYIGWTILLTFIAALISHLEPNAIGSGIPEMKSLLTGAMLPRYLSLKVFFAKYLGLIIAVGGGLFLATEGPFVHLSSILAKNLIRLRYFRILKQNSALIHQLLSAAITAGVAASVASPIGGLMFSIEVSSNYYPTRSYTLAFFVASLATLTSVISRNIYHGHVIYRPLILTEFGYGDFQTWEILIFASLGVVMGVLGSFFVFLTGHFAKKREQFYKKRYGHPIFFILLVSAGVGFLTYPGLIGDTVSSHSPHKALATILTIDPLESKEPHYLSLGYTLQPYVSLFLWFTVHFFLLPLTLALPVPSGITVSLLAIGGSFGRLVGKVAVENYHAKSVSAGYALVGAASLLSGATQTYSPTMIVLEMTGQLEYLFPVLAAVIISVAVSRSLNISIFERITLDKKIPFLPTLLFSQYRSTAEQVMEPVGIDGFLPLTCYLDEARHCLSSTEDRWIPVVNNLESKTLLGMIRRDTLEKISHRFNQEGDFAPPSPSADDLEDEVLDVGNIEVLMRLICISGKGGKAVSQEERERDLCRQDFGQRVYGLMLEEAVQFTSGTPMTFLHLFYTTQAISFGFITMNGSLVGILRRRRLEQFLLTTLS